LEPPRPTAMTDLYGREAELARIDGLLDGARQSRSGVLVLRGDAGIGKSALLDAARERSGDMCVLSACATESETRLPFAAVHQLVRPALTHIERLPEVQARALRGAIGLEPGGSADRFLVSIAVLNLLAEAAERRPVLCLVDDAHWLDDASADALIFAARRLDAEAIVMLFAVREGEHRVFDAPALPALLVEGLDPQAAGALLDLDGERPLSRDVRERLMAETQGNPLALLELSSGLTDAQRSGSQPFLDPLPVCSRVERAFLVRVRRLPADTQTVLQIAAADDSGELAHILQAARHLDVAEHALDAAEQAGLVRVHGSQLELRHPLLSSAVYHGAPLSQRLAAHAALAHAFAGEAQADRRAWHRAAASIEPDAAVVEELEQAAQRAQRRSGFAAASLAYERAAALTADGEAQARRLTAAAENAWFAGRLDQARGLLERARPLASQPTQRADIDRLRGTIESIVGAPADALELLVRGAADVAEHDGDRALELLSEASGVAAYVDDPGAAVAIAESVAVLQTTGTPTARFLTDLAAGVGAHHAGDFAAAAPRLRAAMALAYDADAPGWAEAGHSRMSLDCFALATRAAMYLGDDRAVERFSRRALAESRASGSLTYLTYALARVALTELAGGRWLSASADLREALQLAEDTDNRAVAVWIVSLLALVAGLRGEEEECRTLAGDCVEQACLRGFAPAADFARWGFIVLELGRGQPDRAMTFAREITGSDWGASWTALDRVEAAVRAGEPEIARGWLDMFDSWAKSSAAPWALAVSSHCRALLCEDVEEAERWFAAALASHGGAARPFARARTELAFGELLRRARRRVEARAHVRAALEVFETLGAAPWVERARAELRASGQTARRRDPSTVDDLTAQELHVARFVAEGLTNRDVAAQLFLSPRTIDFHLRNVFRKLGISSRAELARLDLDASPP